jgi:biopolymer transport protein ExbD
MAGSSGIGDENENPVSINVTPLVDVIFCLCVFFMISFKFKQLEGKFDSWLPKGKGSQGMPLNAVIQEVRVALFWDEANEKTVRKIGTRAVPEDDELEKLIVDAHEGFIRLNNPDVPLTIDGDLRVPWDDVVRVMNISKRAGMNKIEFAYNAPPSKSPAR